MELLVGDGPPTYLFRIDDVCDQMDAAPMFARLMGVFRRHRVAPLVGVIPCNLDRSLTNPGSSFRIEDLKQDIAANTLSIGLHGCHHRYEYSREGIWGLDDQSEFAGVPEQIQRDRIQLGLRELQKRLGVRPDFFVAPSHSYDHVTLRVLEDAGLAVSDGIALFPFYLKGVLHIPAQLWSAKPRGDGQWTVMIHPQEADDGFLADLDEFLAANRQHVVDFTMQCLQPYIGVTWTWPMSIRSQLFRRAFYLRWHLYQGTRRMSRMVSGQLPTHEL